MGYQIYQETSRPLGIPSQEYTPRNHTTNSKYHNIWRWIHVHRSDRQKRTIKNLHSRCNILWCSGFSVHSSVQYDSCGGWNTKKRWVTQKLLENWFELVISEAPFLCHSFVCDSRDQARKITFALAAVFQHYGKKIKEESKETGKVLKRLAIDLRSPEEQAENGMDDETDAWFVVVP